MPLPLRKRSGVWNRVRWVEFIYIPFNNGGMRSCAMVQVLECGCCRTEIEGGEGLQGVRWFWGRRDRGESLMGVVESLRHAG